MSHTVPSPVAVTRVTAASEACSTDHPPLPQSACLSFDQAVAGDGSALRALLALEGYCVVRGVVDKPALLERWRCSLRAFVTSLGYPGRFDDPASVADRTQWPLGCPGMFNGFGCGHTVAAWEARLNTRVRLVFASLWRTEKLVTSIGAVCIERPRREALSEEVAVALHTDQNPYSAPDEMDAVQGALSLTDTDELSGGTTVVSRSHAHHRSLLVAAFPTSLLAAQPELHWHVLSPEQREWLLAQPGCAVLDVCTQPGDLVLWDSRCASKYSRCVRNLTALVNPRSHAQHGALRPPRARAAAAHTLALCVVHLHVARGAAGARGARCQARCVRPARSARRVAAARRDNDSLA